MSMPMIEWLPLGAPAMLKYRRIQGTDISGSVMKRPANARTVAGSETRRSASRSACCAVDPPPSRIRFARSSSCFILFFYGRDGLICHPVARFNRDTPHATVNTFAMPNMSLPSTVSCISANFSAAARRSVVIRVNLDAPSSVLSWDSIIAVMNQA